MNVQTVKNTRVTDTDLRAVLDVIPRGYAHRKTGPEICDMLSERGIHMKPRKLRKAVERLRFDHWKVICAKPGIGYWIGLEAKHVDEVIAWFDSYIKELVDTRNTIKRNWLSQPLRGGEQLEFYEGGNGKKGVPIQTPKGLAKLPGGIAIKRSNRLCSLTPEQANFAVILYWQIGLPSFKAVAMRMSKELGKYIPKDRIQSFFDRLGLPRRSRGGWGSRTDESKLEVCRRKIAAHFAEQEEDHAG